jgi:hypothetical protein
MLAYRYKFQLHNKGFGHQSGPAMIDSGGVVYVAAAGDPAKATIQDRDGAALANPLALTRGGAEFYCDSAEVDLFIRSPDGAFVTLWDVAPDEIHEIPVDSFNPLQVMVIPFAAEDITAAAETDTGFDFAVGDQVLPHPSIRVTTVDATETIDVGLLSSETAGDADGFIAAASVATEGLVQGLILNGGNTMGALFERQDSANAGDLVPAAHAVTGSNATSVTLTLTAGSDTAEGYIYLPYLHLPYNKPRASMD